ncbi:MAG: hypothetical protein Q8P84_07250 [Deltaproteobacteria bacterium]|nr:hypothetical protein [Deltaproteobacteria bacterium]MDZ4224441.1 hypothetical protein [bacterium]
MKKWGWMVCLGLMAQTYGYGSLSNNPYNQNNQYGTGNNPYYQPNQQSKTELFQNYLQVIGGMLNNLNSFQQHVQTQHYSNQATSRGYNQQNNSGSFSGSSSGNSFGR